MKKDAQNNSEIVAAVSQKKARKRNREVIENLSDLPNDERSSVKNQPPIEQKNIRKKKTVATDNQEANSDLNGVVLAAVENENTSDLLNDERSTVKNQLPIEQKKKKNKKITATDDQEANSDLNAVVSTAVENDQVAETVDTAGGKKEQKRKKKRNTMKDEADAKTEVAKKKKSYDEVMSFEERFRTVFVGNIPMGVTKKDLMKIFREAGPIESVRFRSIIPLKNTMSKKVAAIKKEFSMEGRDNFNAFVKYEDKSSVEAALKINGRLFGEHRLQVDKCTKEKHDKKRSVFIGNLPFRVKDDHLLKHFADCGEIERIRIIRNNSTGRSIGVGFVLFKDTASMELALKLNGEAFKHRPLRIQRATHSTKRYQKATNGAIGAEQRKNKKDKKSKLMSEKKTFMS